MQAAVDNLSKKQHNNKYTVVPLNLTSSNVLQNSCQFVDPAEAVATAQKLVQQRVDVCQQDIGALRDEKHTLEDKVSEVLPCRRSWLRCKKDSTRSSKQL
eukprot:TRINITY_DN87002_c0_g1_i1.p1 TRINITY_DN87002_c0_g1~~TRINITY_DN87002_c0_g1_i1.p1  ORF type:complete len:113 (-),score=9.55 TRINITY_DN87002_c0_g1_i1:75-374(-)